mmetsp:Transcript_29499/g.54002  ORF Transcript_29499/g.54002 Transcript_29499/m.54002 type:complete len:83 (-) Transcript_29499:1161-1409(-)
MRHMSSPANGYASAYVHVCGDQLAVEPTGMRVAVRGIISDSPFSRAPELCNGEESSVAIALFKEADDLNWFLRPCTLRVRKA